ncbi:hypothetical protein [Chryseobacterium turcicum]|uniref:DUF3828 domain-containing protein n=1 Tax=Chryseobacterium turcicum TaxID=2898076 RepID=A0A9Q3V3H5_9FLAO|nr:hypothetical protein [Chryseobacterium turcicum]MCD1117256.1 hypothetical protein [Chryseobacterium turcicum]
MKRLLLSVFFLLSIFCFSQDADEKEIYSLIINSFPEKELKINDKVFRLNFEGNPDEKQEFKIFMRKFLFLRKSTYENFIANNRKENTIYNNFNSDKNIVIVNYKNNGSIIFSNLGFDNSKSQALVQYSKEDVFLALFEKKNNKWFLKERKKLKDLLLEFYDNH